MRSSYSAGFTVLEALMVLAVVVLGVAMGSVAFQRWVVRARTAEATAMLVDIANQEAAFKAGGGRYLAVRGDAHPDGAPADESPAGFYPLPVDSPALASARQPTRVDDPGRLPAAWRALGLRPWKKALYCTYLVNAGGEGPLPSGLRYGGALLAATQAGPWFYALAACNIDGPVVFGLSSESSQVKKFAPGG